MEQPLKGALLVIKLSAQSVDLWNDPRFEEANVQMTAIFSAINSFRSNV